jgi:hypothetical protein
VSDSLDKLHSLINGYTDAKDNDRVFTFIEFIKEFGFDNSSDVVLTIYKSYLTKWANIKKRSDFNDDKEYVKEALTDTLKSITLTYSSYEEQDFLANLDWESDEHKKAMIPFFAEKIKNICDFYRKKRHEVTFIADKNKFKGTRKSLEEIIYEKIINFYFDRKNQVPQMAELQQNLTITLEEYVDTYSEYFDIPRDKTPSDKSRQTLLEANINNVDYRDYLETNKVMSEMIYSGEVYLEEIPLIAEVGLDLSAKCAGDVETLRQRLLNNATLNQVSLSEQISIRRRLYQKLLGCDLYYLYADEDKNLQANILVKADNPSGNLLNCGTADIVLTQSEQLELISHIGLFFKPDKLGILKINADNFVWEINYDKIKPDTFYVFPDPSKYGDIGNLKDTNYPLIFEYKLSSVIKNLSSGIAKDDPMCFLAGTTWNTYYSKQDNDFKLIDNKKFQYAFTSLNAMGIIQSYQEDMLGNEYALLKGIYIDEENKTISLPSNSCLASIQYVNNSDDLDIGENLSYLINGGYFVDPHYKSNNKRVGRKFNHNLRMRLFDNYLWTGITPKGSSFFTPDIITTHLNFGEINSPNAFYVDHYEDIPSLSKLRDDDIFTNVFESFITNFDNYTVIYKDYTKREFENLPGILYINNKIKSSLYVLSKDIKDFVICGNLLFIIKDSEIDIYSYEYTDNVKYDFVIKGIKIAESALVKILYNEKDDIIFIAYLTPRVIDGKHYFDLNISSINPNTFEYKETFVSYQNHTENNFQYPYSLHKLEDFVFSYNNNSNSYIISYIINDSNEFPNLYLHQFKMFNQEQFDESLVSICYKNEFLNDMVYLNNDTIDSSGYCEGLETPIQFFVEYNG